MRISYDILISVKVMHEFFDDKVFEDFELVPDIKCKSILNQFSLMPKKVSNTWHLLYQKEGPLPTDIKALEDKEMSFIMRLKNSLFYSVTDESFLPDPFSIMYFTASIRPGMMPIRLKTYQLALRYQIQTKTRPVRLTLTDLKGKTLLNNITVSNADEIEYPFDLSSFGEGAYMVVEKDNSTATNFEQFYSTKTFWVEPFYGVIFLETKHDLSNNFYEIEFKIKSNIK
jgi:hypothetical protein